VTAFLDTTLAQSISGKKRANVSATDGWFAVAMYLSLLVLGGRPAVPLKVTMTPKHAQGAQGIARRVRCL